MSGSTEAFQPPFTVVVDGKVVGEPLNSWKEAMEEARRQRSLDAGRTVLVRDRYLTVVTKDTEFQGGATTHDG